MKKALITGITGQDGAYLSKLLLEKGYKVFGTSRKKTPDTSKLAYLGLEDKVKIYTCNLADKAEVHALIDEVRPNEIYNLAGQSSVNYSYQHPDETLRDNILSVLNLLEAICIIDPAIRIYQSSTSELFGNKTKMPINEDSIIDPANPYGVSKAAGYFMAKNYRETFGIFAANGVLFNHESHLRDEKYFMRKLIRTAIAISKGADEYVYLGQQHNTRDFGYSPNYVESMWLMLQAQNPSDYVICSGQPVSIRSIAEHVLGRFGVSTDRIKIDPALFRTPNVPDIYGDNSKAKSELGWQYDLDFFQVLDILIDEELQEQKRAKSDKKA